MTNLSRILKPIVTALCLGLASVALGQTQEDQLDMLFEQLSDPASRNWQQVEDEIWAIWLRSGSDSMDLLLERGRKALEDGETDKAIEHLTALVDHAPDFAEGWNTRATAYYRAGLFGPALDDIRRTLALNPRHFGALSGLGLILEEMGLPDDALFAYREAQKLNPHQTSVNDHIKRLETQTAGTEL